MRDHEYYASRDDRLLRYPEARRLDQTRWIAISAAPDYLQTYAGQVAVLTAANLLGRMSRRVVLDIPAIAMVASLPWAEHDLRAFALAQMQAADPRGDYRVRQAQEGDHILHLGASGAPVITHGSGWLAYHGPSSSPLPLDDSANPVGAALAVIAAAARLAVNGFDCGPQTPLQLNAFDWTHQIGPTPPMPSCPDLGSLWTVGTGSVGTTILYFLTLATRKFSPALFDGDKVKRLNITRSPIFADSDVGASKVMVTANHLRACGIADVVAEPKPLHESRRWLDREAGTPDLVIAAANEHNVRHLIESQFPPIQIYGTTGKNWQASVIRHAPLIDPCSCCLFPEATYAATACATDAEAVSDKSEQIDASLPFLSFAAGLMAAAEILKLHVPGYVMKPNRAVLMTKPDLRLVRAAVPFRDGCTCQTRSETVHAKMIGESRFAGLSISA
ncbi:ThiF family adenylyltransferase [Defluviimonas sp. WL0075]|uniref:ThiF family adenylyltransferase n=1 Tax=Albidovulum sediminicola TaxID=2984331 RepID=A0ABT2Z000_9RHOB|nr:ThiF family adenylyltransferase [Defluviimonas sp. WL0075]MCV2864410.1 ThiF family adenylyltransferase [Defluviimonas sp. WL0075]